VEEKNLVDFSLIRIILTPRRIAHLMCGYLIGAAMKRNIFVFYIVGFFMLPIIVCAQDSERPIARQLVSIAVNPSSDYTGPGRAKFVNVLATYCTEILNALPTNSPTEDEWILAELKTSDSAKIRRLVSSSEWSRRELKSIFEGCRQSATDILRAQKLTERSDLTVRYEAAKLIQIALTFNDGNDIHTFASRAGLSPTAWQLDFIGTIRRAIMVAALRTLENK
jgi:hypothetical protein